MEGWDSDVLKFLELCATHEVRMLMVGGGAVNFHGYQRHLNFEDLITSKIKAGRPKDILDIQELQRIKGF